MSAPSFVIENSRIASLPGLIGVWFAECDCRIAAGHERADDVCVAVAVVHDGTLNLNVRIPVIPGGHPDQAVSAGVDYIGHSVFEIRGVGKYGINNKLPAFIYESVFAVIAYPSLAFREVSGSREFRVRL